MGKIGFACKWIDHPHQVKGVSINDDAKQYNTCTTTISWLNRQNKSVAENKLWELMVYNLDATLRLVTRVSKLPKSLRMLRLSSDILPAYTEPTWCYFWKRPDVVQYLEKHFLIIGDTARASGTRLSMHPGQFTVLASDRPDVVSKSIIEFEYHADMVRYMGYGKEFQDFKINVHISGRAGPEGIRKVYNTLSNEARNCITIENEEMTYGLDDCLSLSDIVPIVLDIHHYYIREGEYIQADDVRVQKVIDSWRGIRPTCHYSVSREDLLHGFCADTLLDYNELIKAGYKKQQLRAHSDFYWNNAINDWALTFTNKFDIICESKGKNLSSMEFYSYGKIKQLFS